jgi:hypothetical protein
MIFLFRQLQPIASGRLRFFSVTAALDTKMIFLLRKLQPIASGRNRFFSVTAALDTLRLKQSDFSPKDLRDAYFTAAKLCHPDLNKTKSNGNLTERFLKITEAYELLQKRNTGFDDDEIDMTHIITKTEEQMYRDACRQCLGLDAETVEESKKCPLFRDWLKGQTDAAFTWSNFFMSHGGLAPMLRKKKPLSIDVGDVVGGRRRRKSSIRVE